MKKGSLHIYAWSEMNTSKLKEEKCEAVSLTPVAGAKGVLRSPVGDGGETYVTRSE